MTFLALPAPRPAGRRAVAVGCVAAVLVLTQAAGAGGARPQPASTAADHSALDLADSGRTIQVTRGAHIVVRLPGGASGGYHRPHTSAPSQVSRTAAHGGYPTPHRAVAHFVAVGTGRATLSSINDYLCLHTTPRCLPPQRQWLVHIAIQARSSAAATTVGRQTVEVRMSPAPNGPGFTGSRAHRIVAVFADDPSARVFHHYNRAKPIPTTLQLPCEGTRAVRFAARHASPSSRVDRVAVQYGNIAD